MTQKHVFLPEEIQTRPLAPSVAPAPPPPSRFNSDMDTSSSVPAEDERTEAEKMTKAQRQDAGLPRLTAYATAESYRMKLLQAFLKREHGVGVVRVFDDAVYAVYTLPLLPGYGADTKVRSSPAVKSPGGVSLLEQMTEAEEIGYHDGFFPPQATEDGSAQDHIHSNEYVLSTSPSAEEANDMDMARSPPEATFDGHNALPTVMEEKEPTSGDATPETEAPKQLESLVMSASSASGSSNDELQFQQQEEVRTEQTTQPEQELRDERRVDFVDDSIASNREESISPQEHLTASREAALRAKDDMERRSHYRDDYYRSSSSGLSSSRPNGSLRKRRKSSTAAKVAEVVFFDYGVTVFFGLTEREERDILEDCDSAGVWVKGVKEDDWEVEECHYVSDFCRVRRCSTADMAYSRRLRCQIYDPDASYPRIYNDMFSESTFSRMSLRHTPLTTNLFIMPAFKSRSHLLKLSVSHAIAQSTKLSIYEGQMQDSFVSTALFPKELAETGELSLARSDALRITGRLFTLRIDVNLSSGILGTLGS